MTRQISVSIFILGLLCCLFKPAVQVQEKPVKLYVGVDVAKKNPKAKGAKPEEFINIAMLKEIDQSGFIDKLYHCRPDVEQSESGNSLIRNR